jgi:transcription antitermination factor NusG
MPFWAVCRSSPARDRLAAEGVALAGYETFVPKIRVRVGAQWKTSSLFPSYFFVRIADQWRIIERTIGVHSVIKTGSVPAKCPDEEIAGLLERSDRDGIIRLGPRPSLQPSRHEFAPGATVAIATGPFQGFSAIYAGQTAGERELILLDLLGRQTPVTIAAGLLAPSP